MFPNYRPSILTTWNRSTTSSESEETMRAIGLKLVVVGFVVTQVLTQNVRAYQVPAVAALPGVRTVRQLHDYQLDLSETVPYIGATAVQNVGFNGAGVRVAVLDTGIDYTHKFFGGPGTAAAYTAAYGTTTADTRNTTTDGLFPTAKVVGGFDFVGERWPSGPLAPDPDPIDCGPSVI